MANWRSDWNEQVLIPPPVLDIYRDTPMGRRHLVQNKNGTAHRLRIYSATKTHLGNSKNIMEEAK